MNKLFRPKCLRRVLLCLALLFPIVYLCGGLFFALAGAHGEQMFAEPIYTEEYIEVEQIADDGQYILSYSDVSSILSSSSFESKNFVFDFRYRNAPKSSIAFFSYDGSRYMSYRLTGNPDADIARYIVSTDSYIYYGEPPWVLTFSYSVGAYDFINYLSSFDLPYTLSKLMLVPTEFVPENNSAYTDFIFSQPFANDNFISTLGRDLIDGSTKGFNPMNELFRTINSNVMHFDDTDNLAMFGLGYVYYAVNVLIIYEILILAVKLIMLPLKAVDLFDKKEDI